MEKLVLTIWVFLGSLVGVHHQAAVLGVQAIASPKKPPPAPTIACSGSHCSSPSLTLSPSPTALTTQLFPTPSSTPLAISNWVRYLDSDAGVVFNMPSGWAYFNPPNADQEAEQSVVAFKPAHTTLEETGGNAYCVAASLLISDYQSELQRLSGDGKYEQEPITMGNGTWIHFSASDAGYYLLNKDGKAIEFGYLTINGRDYGQVAEQMVKSLVFLKQ